MKGPLTVRRGPVESRQEESLAGNTSDVLQKVLRILDVFDDVDRRQG
jgi:hypothetical protein